jgi:protein-disulfide isomerase
VKTYFPPRLRLPVSQRDHIRGKIDAPVTLVEYGDYECPYCGEANPVVDQVREDMGDTLRFVFRNFPLTEAHPHAEHAAEAAEAAGAHDKFWEMHDMLYAHQRALEDRNLANYANLLRVPFSVIERALTQHTYQERVREDFLSGVRSGVNGTPTFFVNGVRHDGPYDRDSLLAAFEDALRAIG